MFRSILSAASARFAVSIGALACALALPALAAGTTPTPAERGAAAKAFVSKWGAYVERVYDVPVGVWAQRMVPTFVAADGSNLRNALRRDTFEGAVAINVTVVTPNIGGYATVYPYNATQPLAASVNYTAGAVVNNAIVTRIPNPLTNNDFTIYTFGQAHFVADIVGYYSAPQATALECTNTSVSSFTLAANSVNFFNNPNCPAGYRATTPYCWTASSGVINQGSGYNANAPGNATFCSWQNTTASSQTVFGGNVCCRIPGR